MKTKPMSWRKKCLMAVGILLLLLVILAGVFFWYVSDYYRAEDVALDVMAQDSNITVLPAPAGSDPADGRYLHSGAYALPHGDF